MKARAVKGLDPRATLADSAEQIIRVRTDELFAFVPAALDPEDSDALHDMRIAAKRLRYLLELTGFCFGPYAGRAARHAKELQGLIGEIHDCDEMLPRVLGHPGVEAYATFLQARRALLHERFVTRWAGLQRGGFRKRLEQAIAERPAAAPLAGVQDAERPSLASTRTR